MPEDKIDYRYLNMDTNCFADNQSALIEQLGPGALIRALPNYKYGQFLIAAGHKSFSEMEAMLRCRRLTGIIRRPTNDCR